MPADLSRREFAIDIGGDFDRARRRNASHDPGGHIDQAFSVVLTQIDVYWKIGLRISPDFDVPGRVFLRRVAVRWFLEQEYRLTYVPPFLDHVPFTRRQTRLPRALIDKSLVVKLIPIEISFDVEQVHLCCGHRYRQQKNHTPDCYPHMAHLVAKHGTDTLKAGAPKIELPPPPQAASHWAIPR